MQTVRVNSQKVKDVFPHHIKEAQLNKVAIKDSSYEVQEKIMSDIRIPKFYDIIADLESLTLFQGSHFVDSPHYEKQEQLICAVDGAMSIVLVPHINRQEVYPGQLKDSTYFDPTVALEE